MLCACGFKYTPLWIQGLKRLVLWIQILTLLEDQGLWIQVLVLLCSCAKATSSGIRARQVFSRSSLQRMFVAFQDRIEQRFDDVMNTLKIILSNVSGLESHHQAGTSYKSEKGKLPEEYPGNGRNVEHMDISTSTNSRDRYGDEENRDFRMNIDLPCFNGSLKIEEFLDWLAEVERFFDYTKIPEEKQAKLVAYKLKGVTSAWWEQVQQTRNRSAKSLVRTWVKMKKLLKNRFLPPDFEQVLYQQFQRCRQGNRSVLRYTEEFHR